MHVPLVHEISGAYGKAVAAVRVPNFEHRAGHALAFRRQQFQFSIDGLNHRLGYGCRIPERHLPSLVRPLALTREPRYLMRY
jgi:hypothetical protein